MKFTQQGYTLAGALIMIAVLSVFMALSLPIWTHVKQRENEEELIFRGREYREAIARYHQKFNSYPPDLDTLYEQKFIRKLYVDPMTESGKWKVLRPDSLIETGEAGQINQPGSKKNQNSRKEKNDEKQEIERGDEENQTDENEDAGALQESEEAPEEEETETLGPVAGVVSRSKKKSIKIFNGQTNYNKWTFTFAVQEGQPQEPKDKKPKDDKKPKRTEGDEETDEQQEENDGGDEDNR